MNLKKIKETLDSAVGKELRDYLLVRLKELKSIDSIKIYKTPTHQAIELKAQKKAFKKLRDILGEIMTIEETDDTKREKDEFYAM